MEYGIRPGLIQNGKEEYVIYNKRTGKIVDRGFPTVEDAKHRIIRIYNASRKGKDITAWKQQQPSS